MSENIVTEADSTSESTEAIRIDPSQATDADGLAGQLERMLTPQAEPAPPSEEPEENEEQESLSEEPSSDESSEEGETEEVLSQTESEDSTEVEQAAESEDSPSPQKGLLKRIDKLTAKRRVAESKVDDLELEVKTLREQLDSREDLPELTNIPTANPYSNLSSKRAVEAELEKAEEIIEWCEDNPDGAVVEKKDGEDVDYSSDDIRNIKKNARKALRKHLPDRLEYLQEEEQVSSEVDRVFPY